MKKKLRLWKILKKGGSKQSFILAKKKAKEAVFATKKRSRKRNVVINRKQRNRTWKCAYGDGDKLMMVFSKTEKKMA